MGITPLSLSDGISCGIAALPMTAREICYSYHSAKHKAQQIEILSELSGVDSMEIIKTLAKGGEELPESTVKKLYKRLDRLDMQIREREREYKEIVAVLRENYKSEESIYAGRMRGQRRI